MAWFEDLSPYTYGRAARSAPGATPLNVGWLERGHSFRAAASTSALIDRLRDLVEHAPTNVMRGQHFCDLCPEDVGAARPSGHAEIRVTAADGTRFAAPTLLHHYVSVHGYQPPQVFVDAVLSVRISVKLANAMNFCLGCGSTLERVNFADAELFDGTSRRPVRIFEFDCERCGVTYKRTTPLG